MIKLRSIEDLIYYYFFEREKTIFVLKVDVLPPLLQGFPYLEMRYSIQIVNSRNEWVKGQNSGFFLNGPTPASFSFIFGLFKQTLLQFLQQINVKNVHPVSGAGIRTHNLLITSLLP